MISCRELVDSIASLRSTTDRTVLGRGCLRRARVARSGPRVHLAPLARATISEIGVRDVLLLCTRTQPSIRVSVHSTPSLRFWSCSISKNDFGGRVCVCTPPLRLGGRALAGRLPQLCAPGLVEPFGGGGAPPGAHPRTGLMPVSRSSRPT